MGICLIFFLAKVNVTVSSVGGILTPSIFKVKCQSFSTRYGTANKLFCDMRLWAVRSKAELFVWTHLLQQLFRWSHVHTTNLNIYKTPNLQKQWVSTCFKLFASISFVLFFFLALCSWLQGLAEVRYVIGCIFVLRNPNSESGIVVRQPF